MKTSLKKLTIKKHTATLVCDMDTTWFLGKNLKRNAAPDINEVKAIAMLLGGYNEFGRNVDIEKFNEIRDKFCNIVFELKSLI